ncbi:zinc-dependent alcohol dehydrogenase [Microlunatus speluncae]|uniref:zinc-dependent alcohol dehydrogenase n=1 Tax=Microlunatus speluncae TaxID=2594267 RepID=UPI0012661FCA|nr:zinc-binding dehydrogenase [Microlunatus speluncae]
MTITSQRQMWAYQLERPGHLVRRDVPVETDPGPGEVLIRVEAGGICGSDLPKFLTAQRSSPRDEVGPGFPLHEIAGTVMRSEDPRFQPGDAVCGCMPGQRGLAELVRVPADTVVPVPDGLSLREAVVVQPLATVLYALDRLPDVRGRSAAVIGLGPIGLLFTHVLHQRGARVTGIDPVDRSAVASTFGVDELFIGSVADWVDRAGEPAEIVIEAVGHQTETIPQAIRGTALRGHLYAFGVPDDLEYTLPFREAFDRAITLYLGITQDWNGALIKAAAYLAEHRDLLPPMITHVLGPDAVNDAYTLCAGAAPDRLKVIIDLASEADR